MHRDLEFGWSHATASWCSIFKSKWIHETSYNCHYCWWKKSQTTTWDGAKTPVNNGISTTNLNWFSRRISEPSTVYHSQQVFTKLHLGCVSAWLNIKPEDLHPGRLTWNLRIHPWKRKIIFQTIIFRFYVNLPGCIQNTYHIQQTHEGNESWIHHTKNGKESHKLNFVCLEQRHQSNS